MYYLYPYSQLMIHYKQASTEEQLQQILKLQQQNLPQNLSSEIQQKEGFLTVEHTLEVLREMNDVCGHIIAVKNEKIVGYALCMHPKFADTIAILRPMFHEINKVVQEKRNYMVMGQICIDKVHRGQGVFRGLYTTMTEKLPSGFDSIITEVDVKNIRSLRAHTAIGFKEIKRYESGGKRWSLIVLTKKDRL